MNITIDSISKKFGNFHALDQINLEIQSGELLALLGPSGSGKTTLLRIIAGLETADANSGGIWFGGENVTNTNAKDRGIGFVFQHYALFRHMTILENIAFGLRVRKRKERPSRPEIRRRCMELLELVQLQGLHNRYPNQLSGGQRQRVALARALAIEPKVLLLDEPFVALDAKVRKELRRWLRKLHEELHITSIFVTHDQEEALELADRVVIMNEGKIAQAGTPDEVYNEPADAFVFKFLGDVNTLHASSVEAGGVALNGNTSVYVRPHDLQITEAATASGAWAKVLHVQAVGPMVRVELKLEGAVNNTEVALTRDEFAKLGIALERKLWVSARHYRTFASDKKSEAASAVA